MTNTAHQGRRVEHAIRADLAAHGYDIVRAAASKGPADLVAIKFGQVVFVNVKRTRLPDRAEREELLRLAALLPGVGVGVIARKPPRRPIRYDRVLTADGHPSARVAWTPDEAATHHRKGTP